MDGSPTFTIVLSSPTMNRLRQQTASMSVRRARTAVPVTVLGPGSGWCWASGASSRLRTGTGTRSGSRTGTFSDLQRVPGTGACIGQTPRGTYSPRTSRGWLCHVWPGTMVRAHLGRARPGDRELVDSVDALDPAQLRRPVEGEAQGARREERQGFFQFGPGQVGTQAVVCPGPEREPPGVTGRGDVEVLAPVAFAVSPLGADGHD